MNVSYDEEILKLIFGKYGPIKDCLIIPEKKASIMEFLTLSSAVIHKNNYKIYQYFIYSIYNLRKKHMKNTIKKMKMGRNSMKV